MIGEGTTTRDARGQRIGAGKGVALHAALDCWGNIRVLTELMFVRIQKPFFGPAVQQPAARHRIE